MPNITIRDPKTGERLGSVDDEKGTTEISETWKKKTKNKEPFRKRRKSLRRKKKNKPTGTKTTTEATSGRQNR